MCFRPSVTAWFPQIDYSEKWAMSLFLNSLIIEKELLLIIPQLFWVAVKRLCFSMKISICRDLKFFALPILWAARAHYTVPVSGRRSKRKQASGPIARAPIRGGPSGGNLHPITSRIASQIPLNLSMCLLLHFPFLQGLSCPSARARRESGGA
jgi:hypothetical protein